MLNVDVYIPIRLGSERLPKKALKKIDGVPIIKYLIERLENASNIRNIIVCTTISKSDDELADYLSKEKILFFRGNEHDILDRYLNTAKKFQTDYIVNVEGDDIYTDSDCVEIISKNLVNSNLDYVDINDMPFGLSTSGISFSALNKICSVKKSKNTETGYKQFFTNTGLFKISHIDLKQSYYFPKNTRLSLDYEEDFQLAKEIFSILGNNFHKSDLSKLFKNNPNLLKITDGLEERYNLHFTQNQTDISTKDI